MADEPLTATPDENERARLLSEFKFVKDLESRMLNAYEEGIAEGIAAGIVETMELSAAKGREISLAKAIELGAASGMEHGEKSGRRIGWDDGFKSGVKQGQNRVLDLLRQQQRYVVAEIERQLAASVCD
jgi:flagellar biosynthesis/type III secretory pathway protein FliH